MKIIAIIQARMGSTRLPGKVMKKLCGKTVLQHVIERVRACSLLNEVIVATTIFSADDEIVAESEKCGVKWFRGSEDDVLARYYWAAKKYGADIVVRITSDCPLFDPQLLGKMIEYFNRERDKGASVDYLSNSLISTFPRGLEAEVFTFKALEYAFHNANKPSEREHVTPYLYQHPELFCLKTYENNEDLSSYRWTLDTIDDFRLIKEIYSALYNDENIFLTDEVVELMRKRPELIEINAYVEQKKLGQ
ncbi:MAG: cytidylyltransferase domain-containing protein [Candidatus Anammoxibacter sp.]